MADKTIGELPGVTSLDSDSLFVAQQQGVASKVTGAQLTQFANVETAAQVAAAQAAAEAAKKSETEAESSKKAAQTAAEQYPYIGENGHWYVFSASTGQFVDSGVAAQGPTGPTGPAGGVDSFNGRTGAVMPAAGDYTAAMVEAAPEGYGLGEHFGRPITDCNEATVGGWYQLGKGSLNTPELIPNHQYATLLVVPRGSNTTQLYYNPLITYYVAVRIKANDGWGLWEYINPPMSLGVEYRTVERYKNKPVYAKLVNCGNLTAGSVKTINFDSSGTLQSIVDARGELFNSGESWQVSTMLYGGTYADTSPLVIAARVSSGNGIIYAYANNNGANTRIAYIVVRYTKSTD